MPFNNTTINAQETEDLTYPHRFVYPSSEVNKVVDVSKFSFKKQPIKDVQKGQNCNDDRDNELFSEEFNTYYDNGSLWDSESECDIPWTELLAQVKHCEGKCDTMSEGVMALPPIRRNSNFRMMHPYHDKAQLRLTNFYQDYCLDSKVMIHIPRGDFPVDTDKWGIQLLDEADHKEMLELLQHRNRIMAIKPARGMRPNAKFFADLKKVFFERFCAYLQFKLDANGGYNSLFIKASNRFTDYDPFAEILAKHLRYPYKDRDGDVHCVEAKGEATWDDIDKYEVW